MIVTELSPLKEYDYEKSIPKPKIQPTPLQRLQIYKTVLIWIERKDEFFLCNEIAIAYELMFCKGRLTHCSRDICALFPEFIECRPKGVKVDGITSWFHEHIDGKEGVKQKRIELIKSLIKKLS